MRVTVEVGNERMRIPVDEGSKTMAWLQAQICKRWEKQHGELLRIKELRTRDNIRLDNEDQVFAVCKEDEVLVAVLGTGIAKEVGVGDMINQYYLTRLIGEGTYGRVYKGRDLNLHRYVAVKVLRREKANQINTRRFLREAELNGTLSGCPHIVTVHDFGRTRGGTLFIVMELLKGRPMNEFLDRRIHAQQPFSVLECIHVMSQVLRGLHAAHSHNPAIVHRDLKPDNIMLDCQSHEPPGSVIDCVVKIMDFGIAWHDEIVHETLACGTRMYSSPEQTRKNAKLDGRSDIWSCGVILYQMLSLLVDVPFDPVEIVLGRSSVPPLSRHTRTPLSEHMHGIVMRALEVDPSKRWQSAEEMCAALHEEEGMLLNGSHNANAIRPIPKTQHDIVNGQMNDGTGVSIHGDVDVTEGHDHTSSDHPSRSMPGFPARVSDPTPPSSSFPTSSSATSININTRSPTNLLDPSPIPGPVHPRYARIKRRPFSAGEAASVTLRSKL